MNHYTYILRCSDESLYTGYTNDIGRRIKEHSRGNGAKYTRGRNPVRVVYAEFHCDKSSAMSREYKIKQLSKSEKEELVGDEKKTNIRDRR
jgi:putative endonuclease